MGFVADLSNVYRGTLQGCYLSVNRTSETGNRLNDISSAPDSVSVSVAWGITLELTQPANHRQTANSDKTHGRRRTQTREERFFQA
jgi:hypothetical protein